MSTQYLVAGVSVVSAAVIAGSLICVGLIFNDINNFYDDALSQLEEFQGLSTGAWTSMTDVTVHKAAKNPFLIGRNKRQAQCNCGQQPNNCPPGPRGPRGAPGAPGENGHRGTEGTNGHPGVQISVHGGNDGCITCPVGPPGPAGPDGSVGFPGPDGQPGAPAYGGPSVGRPGPPGPPGNQGAPGRPGSSGEPGRQGKSGVRGRGLPGPAGQRGQPGLRGSDGQPGHPAAPGAPGLMGESGPMGLPGAPGVDGDNGLPGEVGVPGSDAEYCPCPPRDSADNYDIKRASHHGRVYGYSMKASAAARSRAAIARRRVNKHRTARLANSDKKTQHSRSTGQKRVVRRKTEQH